VVAFGLFTRIGGTGSALAALVAGVTTWVLGSHVLGLPYPYLTALAMAAGSYVITATLGSSFQGELKPIEA